jgi:uncharacterized protein (TIGR02118 family)
MIFAIYPKDGMTPEQCAEYVTDVHSKIGERMPKARTLRQFAVTSTHEARDSDIAAFTLLEFDSEEDFNAAAASSVMEEANADVPNFAEHIAVYNVRPHTVI